MKLLSSFFPSNLIQNHLFSDREITGVVSDNRLISPGNIFVAIKGENHDGHLYISDAIQRGACAVVGTLDIPVMNVPYIRVENSRRALAELSSAFYDYPGKDLLLIGITGTDGKTTTANIMHQIFLANGIRSGLISTVSAQIGNEFIDTGFHVTTPEAPDIQKFLYKMVQAGMSHAIVETTSHGLAQDRVIPEEFDVGVITNITHEHLDFHGTYQDYLKAKGKLFMRLSSTKKNFTPVEICAVLNSDDSSILFLKNLLQVESVTYGINNYADLRAEKIIQNRNGLNFIAIGERSGLKNFELEITSPLFGRYNVYNILAALSVSIYSLNISPEAAREGVKRMNGVPGRMEVIDLGQEFTAMVDFAHTPNALKKILEAMKEITQSRKEKGKVIIVFGSAGLRDQQKRRMMAEIAAELSDISILTAEDPRTESLDDILVEMADGMCSKGGIEGQTFFRIPDRREAISYAVKIAGVNDVVITCGKGHEQSMCFGEVEYPWDDRIALRTALADRLGIPGYTMPYLPT